MLICWRPSCLVSLWLWVLRVEVRSGFVICIPRPLNRWSNYLLAILSLLFDLCPSLELKWLYDFVFNSPLLWFPINEIGTFLAHLCFCESPLTNDLVILLLLLMCLFQVTCRLVFVELVFGSQVYNTTLAAETPTRLTKSFRVNHVIIKAQSARSFVRIICVFADGRVVDCICFVIESHWI